MENSLITYEVFKAHVKKQGVYLVGNTLELGQQVIETLLLPPYEVSLNDTSDVKHCTRFVKSKI